MKFIVSTISFVLFMTGRTWALDLTQNMNLICTVYKSLPVATVTTALQCFDGVAPANLVANFEKCTGGPTPLDALNLGCLGGALKPDTIPDSSVEQCRICTPGFRFRFIGSSDIDLLDVSEVLTCLNAGNTLAVPVLDVTTLAACALPLATSAATG